MRLSQYFLNQHKNKYLSIEKSQIFNKTVKVIVSRNPYLNYQSDFDIINEDL